MGRRRAFAGLVPVAAGLALRVVAAAGSGASDPPRASGPFAWLKPAPPPAGWKVARTSGGAVLAYPPEWTPIKTDPGTASVALLGNGERIDGYLNATPGQGQRRSPTGAAFARGTTRAKATATCASSPPPPPVGFAQTRGLRD